MQGSVLVLTQYDGLQKGKLSDLQPLADSVKQAWHPSTVRINSTWIIEQTRPDSCGTIALGHFARLLGLMSLEQAAAFEDLHSSFAVCSRMVPCSSTLIGFGTPAEEAIVLALFPKSVSGLKQASRHLESNLSVGNFFVGHT